MSVAVYDSEKKLAGNSVASSPDTADPDLMEELLLVTRKVYFEDAVPVSQKTMPMTHTSSLLLFHSCYLYLPNAFIKTIE